MRDEVMLKKAYSKDNFKLEIKYPKFSPYPTKPNKGNPS